MGIDLLKEVDGHTQVHIAHALDGQAHGVLAEIEELFRQEQVKSFCLEGDELTLNLYSPDSDGNTFSHDWAWSRRGRRPCQKRRL